MIIRANQMRALEQAAAAGFEQRMIERIRTCFPRHAEVLSGPRLQTVVRQAAAKAQAHALTTERNIALFLDLVCVLGIGFDADPQVPWAARMLAPAAAPTQDERIGRLHARGWEYARKVSADFQDLPEKGGASPFVAAIREIRHQDTREVTAERARSLGAVLGARMKEVLPVKCSVIGDQCVEALVKKAFESAVAHGIRNPRGIHLFTFLMFVVGAGFDRDPQLPWAAEALLDRPKTDPAARTNRLYEAALKALDQWWGLDAAEKA